MPITPQQDIEARRVLVVVRQEERQGSLAGALDVLARGVERHPDNPLLLARYGQRLRGAGRLAESTQVLRRAVGIVPDDRFVVLELAATLRADTRPDEALRLYEGLLRRFPDDPDTLGAWAYDLALLGEPERGVDRLLPLVATRRGRLDLAILLGRVLVGVGRAGEAVRRMDEVLDLQERSYNALVVKALALRVLRLPIAPVVAAAWKLNERAAWSLFLKGEAAEEEGDRTDAIFWHREALSAHARFYLSSLALGRLHAREGDLDAARERLREASATAPWDGRARGVWMRFRFAQGESLPLDRLEADAARRPYGGLPLQLGRIHLEHRKDRQAALPWLRKAAEVAPEDPRVAAILTAAEAGR